MDTFKAARSTDNFRSWVTEAGLRDFEIIGEGGLTEDAPETGLGVWLIFRKGSAI